MNTTDAARDDEFYIGYEGEMPPGIARYIRSAVLAYAGATVAVVAIVVFATATLPSSRFEFGIITVVSGTLRRLPYPVLETGTRRVWLAGAGKLGADATLAGIAEGPVTLRGSLIQRGRHEMLEVRDVVATGAGSTSATVEPASGATHVTLRGEIVDSKCFLGVMNPAEGAVHRDCARRCLSGGLPPMLLVRDGERREELVVLVGCDGLPIARELAPFAGTSVEVSGRLLQDGSDPVMSVATIHRSGAASAQQHHRLSRSDHERQR